MDKILRLATKISLLKSAKSVSAVYNSVNGSSHLYSFQRHSYASKSPSEANDPSKLPLTKSFDDVKVNHREPKRSRLGKYLSLFSGGLLLGTAFVMAYDENSRLAAVEYVPQFQTLFDTFGLSTKKGQLPPSPNSRKDVTNVNLHSLSVSNSSSEKGEPESLKGLIRECSYPEATKEENKTSIYSIAEDSVRLLFSGKLSESEQVMVDQYHAEREASRRVIEEKKKREKEREAQEKRDAAAAESIARKKKEVAECERQKQYEMMRQTKNQEIETKLSKDISAIIESAENAISSSKKAVEACSVHSSELKKALGADSESVAQDYWGKIWEYKEIRNERFSEATKCTQNAEALVKQYLNMINEAKKDEFTKSNETLLSYEAQVKRVENDLKEASLLLNSTESVAQIMQHYYQLLQQDRLNFVADIEKNLPEYKPKHEGSNLTESELSELLAHAHRRVFQLKTQLRESELLQQQRFEEALREQKEQHDKETQEQLCKELSDQRNKFMKAKEEELLIRAQEQEKKIREELARVALRQNCHLNEMLRLQHSQLLEEFNKLVLERTEFEKSTYVDSLARHIAKLDGLAAVLNEKADVDKAVSHVHTLVSATQNLLNKLTKFESNGQEDTLVKLADELDSCLEASPSCSFVSTIIAGLPDRAKQQGIFTQASLEKRFENVINECKKVALFPEAETISKQTVSSVFSKLQTSSTKPKYVTESDLDNAEEMNVQELLSHAQYFVNQHCLSAAVKCMVQLDGIPRALAQDWIEEARLLLEVRQAANVLYSYALSKSSHFII